MNENANTILERFNSLSMAGVEPDRGENVQTYEWPINGDHTAKVIGMYLEVSSDKQKITYGGKSSTIPGMNIQFQYELNAETPAYSNPAMKLPAKSKFYGERFRFPVDEASANLTEGQRTNIRITKERLAGCIRTLLGRNPDQKNLAGDLAAMMAKINGASPVYIKLRTTTKEDGQYTNSSEHWVDLLAAKVN